MTSFRPNEMIAAHTTVFKQSSDAAKPQDCSANFSDIQNFRSPTADQLIGLAKRLYSSRSRRKQFVTPELFGEPGWDMLLALFNAETTGHRLTISSLCAASHCPDTTALRWLERLIQLDLVCREKSPFDGRVFFVKLQPSAHAAIDNYLRETWNIFFAQH